MEFRPRLPAEGINVSHTHPLREAFVLVGGVLAVSALFVVLSALAIDLIVPHIPPHWEARIFAGLWAGSDEEDLDQETRQQRQAVQALLDRLAAHWPEAPYRFRVSILDQPTPNALAFPGGLIGVTSGLLEQVESENELAFVLAHELGHFRHRDHLRSLGRGLVLGFVLTLATGSSQLLQLAPMLAERSFARKQERESDGFGLELVYREYGHVAAANDFFQRIAEPGLPLARELEGYLSTHPVSETRVADLWTLAQQRGWPLRGEPLPFSY